MGKPDLVFSLTGTEGRIPLVLDNVVYSLQRAGGASVYWANIHQRIAQDDRFAIRVIERPDAKDNITRNGLSWDYEVVRECNHPMKRIDQNRRLRVEGKCLFHSSCYRTSKGKDSINVTTVHDFTCKKYYAGFLKEYSFWQIKRAVQNSQALICISESTRKDLLRYIPDARDKLIKVIPHACDEAFGYRKVCRKKQVVFIGNRIVSYKNFEMAVQAVETNGRVRLVIVGAPLNDNERKRLDRLIPGKYESVVFPSASEIASIFNSSTALLYLSEYEGFGIPVLEGMASGVPVIAVDRSSIPEVAGNAAILLKEPTAKKVSTVIDALLDNEDYLEKTVALGLERSKEFSWDRTAAETADFYQEVWNHHR